MALQHLQQLWLQKRQQEQKRGQMDHLWGELVDTADCMCSRGVKKSIPRVMLQAGKGPEHITERLRIELLQA